MVKYLLKRILHGIISIIAVVAIVMILIYSLMNRDLIFSQDGQFTKTQDNLREIYKQKKWEAYGYLDYVPYSDYILEQVNLGNLSESEQTQAATLAKVIDNSNSVAKEWIEKFTKYYESKGYTVVPLNATKTQNSQLYATKDISIFVRLFKYFGNFISIDNIHYVERNVTDDKGKAVVLENTGLKFTLFDPVYNTTESGYYLSLSDNGTTKYLTCTFKKNQPVLSLTSEKSTKFEWDADSRLFVVIDEDDNMYGLGVNEDGNVYVDNINNLTNPISVNYETVSYSTNEAGEKSINFDDYLVLETYTNFIVGIEKTKTPSLVVTINDEEKSLTIKDNALALTTGVTSEAGISYVEGGKLVKKVFSPAIIGTGTEHKYLLYCDNKFPFIHQNLISINLGTSYSVNKGIEIMDTMFNSQDPKESKRVVFPTGYVESSTQDLHSATYSYDSKDVLITNTLRFSDDYTVTDSYKTSMSKTGFSFVIGIIATIISYVLGVPIGIAMARKKDKFVDQLGTIYIIFIIAVPSLAYILMFKAIGQNVFNLPAAFNLNEIKTTMYILPIISLALPSVASLMKWIRRYMIDQMNSDYVKFARSGGLSEREIFNKHILKNAIIPIVHGIPGSILGAVVGAIITESIYLVPGAGYLLTDAISKYDNSVIVGLTLFYATLSIVSLILGDILMSLVDPRISFTDKAR